MDHKPIREKFIVEGRVQGIGFRPHIYRLAGYYGLLGYVRNIGGAVEIVAEGDARALDAFADAVTASATKVPHARVDALFRERVREEEAFSAFSIRTSTQDRRAGDVLPDISICPACEAELSEPGRRQGHYFNNCTVCGPRFTVIESVPYDRKNTSMRDFPLCEACAEEYAAPGDRRFHAETICCNDCGPMLFYQSAVGDYAGDAAFEACVKALADGDLVLIKGIGGYHLACSPYARKAVKKLRALKARDGKPFAVMFPDVEQVREVCTVSAEEEALLKSAARPIVLLRLAGAPPFSSDVLAGNTRCGCFLPYTALYKQLLERVPALILTSANPGGAPILFKNRDAKDFYQANVSAVAGVLSNNRRIVRPAEDSVAAVSLGAPRVLRLGRGYAPQSIESTGRNPQTELLAVGGDLKATFGLFREGKYFSSAYFGDLEDAGVFDRFCHGVRDMEDLMAIAPQAIVCDAHPRYFSSYFAAELAHERGLPLMEVQHHHAHAASVMAEHGLNGPVIGVSFDGTGYGEDGAIWGGEFLVCDAGGYQRAGHLAYSRQVGGDSTAQDAAKSAICFLASAGIQPPEGLSEDRDLLLAALRSGIGYQTSSMGRLFDALSAILNICRGNGYEGECAIKLQEAAESYAKKNGAAAACPAFDIEETEEEIRIGYGSILKAAVYCKEKNRAAFAYGFHEAVADMTVDVCRRIRLRAGIRRVALSGGVFQNELLLALTSARLKDAGFEAYTNRRVPVNDGGIALGQAYVAAARIGWQKGRATMHLPRDEG
jgi:hydrogenase maturation protein HypF